MTLFEYVSVALSIVIAIGATHLLGSIRDVLDPRRRYWVHSLWVGLLLLLYAQLWWSFWGLKGSATWNFATFLMILIGPGLLFVCSTTLVPRVQTAIADWEEHYFAVRGWFFPILCIYGIWAGLGSWFVAGVPLTDPFWLVRLTFVCLCIAGTLSTHRAVHSAIAIAGLVAFLVGQVVFRFSPTFISTPR